MIRPAPATPPPTQVVPRPEPEPEQVAEAPSAGRRGLDSLVDRALAVEALPPQEADAPAQAVTVPRVQLPAQPTAAAPALNKTITAAEQLGKYHYLPDANALVTDAWRPMFAVVRLEDRQAVLLVDVDAFAKTARWEVVRRLKGADIHIAKQLQATAAVIARLHELHASDDTRKSLTVDDSSAQKAIRKMAEDAIDRGASDIHIETRQTHADILFRIHGVRVMHDSVSMDTAMKMCHVLYTVQGDATSKGTAFSPDQPQDTSIPFTHTNGTEVVLRFSSSPIYPTGNLHAVIRITVMEVEERSVDSLGLSAGQLDAINRMLLGSGGLVLVCGPTNSGKSTLLKGVMGRVFQARGPTTKVITVEEPVEGIIKGACQIGVSRGRTSHDEGSDSSAFTKYLRGVLRQDPDVVMVGEIRDKDTAEVCKDMVLAGRKVFTTLHTYSAMDAFSRLIELDVPRALLATKGFLSGVVYQRLVPQLCPDCSIPVGSARDRLDRDLLDRLGRVVEFSSTKTRVRGDGCGKCHNSGYIGRLPVCEFILPDQRLLQLINEHQTAAAYDHWKRYCGVNAVDSEGNRHGVTALAHAIVRMLQGDVDPTDVESNVASLDADLIESQMEPNPEVSASRVSMRIDTRREGASRFRPIAGFDDASQIGAG